MGEKDEGRKTVTQTISNALARNWRAAERRRSLYTPPSCFSISLGNSSNASEKKYFRTRECLRNMFSGQLATQTLLVQTPLGLAIPWRLWGESLEVVPVLLQIDGTVALQGWFDGAKRGFSDSCEMWKTGQIPADKTTSASSSPTAF